MAAVFLTITILLGVFAQIPVLTIIMGVVFVLTLIMAVYMLVCHETFAFGKGNMTADVHKHLVEHLEWNGEGTLLDIGSAYRPVCEGFSKGADHSDGLLGCGVELRKRTV